MASERNFWQISKLHLKAGIDQFSFMERTGLVPLHKIVLSQSGSLTEADLYEDSNLREEGCVS